MRITDHTSTKLSFESVLTGGPCEWVEFRRLRNGGVTVRMPGSFGTLRLTPRQAVRVAKWLTEQSKG